MRIWSTVFIILAVLLVAACPNPLQDTGEGDGDGGLTNNLSLVYVSTVGSDDNTGGDSAAPMATIAAAVQRIVDGGEIRVAGGTYNEMVAFSGSAVINGSYNSAFTAVDFDAHPTIIDGTGLSGSIISGSNGDVELRELILQNGTAGNGGGVNFNGGSLDIVDCWIIDNTATEWGGGGVNVGDCELTISDSRINNNRSSRETDSNGGGINAYGSTLVLQGVDISYNVCNGNSGGGVSLGESTATFTDCIFNENTGVNWGGGINGWESTMTFDSCIFTSNSANDGGGAISGGGTNDYETSVTGCTFDGNVPNDISGEYTDVDYETTPPDDPVFSVTENIYWGAVTVNITPTGEGTIHYTLDGSNPDATSPVSYGSVVITQTSTLKALIIKDNGLMSNVTSATYTIDDDAGIASFSLSPGTYNENQILELTLDDNTEVYYTYTTDGSNPDTPTDSDTPYTTPLSLTVLEGELKTYTYRFIAYTTAHDPAARSATVSPVFSGTWVIDKLPPEPPEVVSVSPVDGAQDVAVDAAINITMSKPIDPASLSSSTIVLECDKDDPVYTVSRSASDYRVIEIDVTGGLTHRADYTLTVTTGVYDTEGAFIEDAEVVSFSTEIFNPFEGLSPDVEVGYDSAGAWLGYGKGVSVKDDTMVLYTDLGGFEGFYASLFDIQNPDSPVLLERSYLSAFYSGLGRRYEAGDIVFSPTNRDNANTPEKYTFAVRVNHISSTDDITRVTDMILSENVAKYGFRVIDVELVDSYLYVATTGDVDGMYIYDVSDLHNPVLVGDKLNTWGDDIHDLVYYNGLLYVLSSDNLSVLSLSDPESPSLAGSYSPLGDCRNLTPFEDRLILGRYDNGAEIVDITSPSSPQLDYVSNVHCQGPITVYGNYGYTFNIYDSSDRYLYILDLSDITEIIELESVYITNGRLIRDLSIDGTRIYLALDDTTNSFVSLTIPDAALPATQPFSTVISDYTPQLPPMSVSVDAASSVGQVDEIRWTSTLDPEPLYEPTYSCTLEEPGQTVYVYGTANDAAGNTHTACKPVTTLKFLNHTGRTADIDTYSISSYEKPKLYIHSDGSYLVPKQSKVGHYSASDALIRTIDADKASGVAMDASGNYYAAEYSDKLILKISPTGTLLYSYPVNYGPVDLELYGSYVYVLHDTDQITILNQSDLTLVNNFDTGFGTMYAMEVDSSGNIWLPHTNSTDDVNEFSIWNTAGVQVATLAIEPSTSTWFGFNSNCRDFIIDSDGSLYISYYTGSLVTAEVAKLDPTGNLIYSHNPFENLIQDTLILAHSLATSADGKIYIRGEVDWDEHFVLEFEELLP